LRKINSLLPLMPKWFRVWQAIIVVGTAQRKSWLETRRSVRLIRLVNPCKECYESRMKPLVRLIALCWISCLCWMGCEQATPSITIHQAVEQGNLKAVQQHIAAKTDLNKPDTAGWTPLHLAAMKGNLAIVQALSAAGADAKRKGKAGKTPLDVAREKGQTAIVQFLQKRNEKSGRGLIDGGLGVSEVLDNP
jgi:hypothetical protein